MSSISNSPTCMVDSAAGTWSALVKTLCVITTIASAVKPSITRPIDTADRVEGQHGTEPEEDAHRRAERGAPEHQYRRETHGNAHQHIPAQVSERYADQHDHSIAASEAGEYALPMPGDGGHAGQHTDQLGATEHLGHRNGDGAFDYIAGENQHPTVAAHVPKNVGGASPAASGGENIHALESRHQVSERDAAQEIADQNRREQAGRQANDFF